ncbi:MAG: protein of unknown function transrane [Chloroflexi bacterium]|jgi:drug/metabolite transporter (DMT)-like permease|nr:protein of unknown function transrane [Chloroflexota bacterium]
MIGTTASPAYRLVGIGLVVLSAASFGTLALFARRAYSAGADPLTVIFVRFAIASVLIGAIVRLRQDRFPTGRVLLTLVLMGGAGYVCQSLAYLTALTLAPASLVALLLYLFPGLVTVLSVVFLHEHLTRVKVGALVVALLGTALTIGPKGGGHPLGIALAVSAAGIYAVYILVGSRVTGRAGALASSTVIMSAAAAVSGVMIVVHGPAFPHTASGWAALVAIALVSTALPIVALFEGLSRVGPTTGATLSTVEPVVTVLLAALFLQEPLGPWQMAGGLFILAAVVALARSAPTRPGKPSDPGLALIVASPHATDVYEAR